jgi:hypothetical protein
MFHTQPMQCHEDHLHAIKASFCIFLCSFVDLDSDLHGSAFNWLSRIWNRMGNADPDPGASKLTKFIKQTWFPAFQKAVVPL